jgi:cytochrome P450
MSVPEPDGLPVLGHTVSFFRDPFGFYEQAEELGDLVRAEVMGETFYYVHHPEDVKRVLVDRSDGVEKPDFFDRTSREVAPTGVFFTDGEQWRRQRTALQPAFYREHIDRYAPTMVDCTRAVADGWQDGGRIDGDDMRSLTLRMFTRTMFGIDDPDGRRVVAEATDAVNDKFETGLNGFIPTWVPTPTNRRYRRRIDALDDVVDSLLARDDGIGGDDATPDLLSVLQATDALSETEIRDQLVTFLFAGHETTSLALLYAWVMLDRHPEVRERLHREVDALDGDPTTDDLDSLPVTDRVIRETLRLYPPVYVTFRQTTEPLELRDGTVPAGATLLLPQYFIHRDERFWDDPETFDPDRWPEGPDHEHAYFPFGGGPRHCIGMRFARTELKLAIPTIARRWRLRSRTDELDFRMATTLRPADPIEFDLERR